MKDLCSLSEKQFLLDLHLPDLLIFHPQLDFHKNYLYMAGHIVLQDKVSAVLGKKRHHSGVGNIRDYFVWNGGGHDKGFSCCLMTADGVCRQSL